MAPLPKFLPRIIGEDADSYLLTTTSPSTYRERVPKWVSKNDVSQELVQAWIAPCEKIEARIDEVKDHPIYQGPHAVQVITIPQTLTVFIDNEPNYKMRKVLAQRNMNGNVWTLAPFDDRATAITPASIVPNDQVSQPTIDLPCHPAPLEYQDTIFVEGTEHFGIFQCTSAWHDGNVDEVSTSFDTFTAVMDNANLQQQNIFEHGGAFLPICETCRTNINTACSCLADVCSKCVGKTLEYMETMKQAMEVATLNGKLCLTCSCPVDDVRDAKVCVSCGGLEIDQTIYD